MGGQIRLGSKNGRMEKVFLWEGWWCDLITAPQVEATARGQPEPQAGVSIMSSICGCHSEKQLAGKKPVPHVEPSRGTGSAFCAACMQYLRLRCAKKSQVSCDPTARQRVTVPAASYQQLPISSYPPSPSTHPAPASTSQHQPAPACTSLLPPHFMHRRNLVTPSAACWGTVLAVH
ncbi:hypothetical protein AOQ84DRAFT_95774 [Glonium stellatum]|uniref:Uncharacterized protein n=1 Tax=Glonium stellatum TaxID=574774 RepID=A0A8E2JQC0_9PEZI|nr:hypothetical protein AOQ84DRAFT_95774 [Glonium stellatum]